MCAGTIGLLQAGAAIGAGRQADGGVASALGYLAIAGWYSFYFLFLSCASGFRQALLFPACVAGVGDSLRPCHSMRTC
jgi:hypothetical protein